ncbi:MAG: 16S rRNA (cytosine(1402)-N(4))-methyltransferase RsmH [Ignavibacteriaceae bacterium]|jgi:16S rRNA (cytosine1402-N4)-methyltransferase|nr:16S rRNA (cytosine(1402)-N(4))-methyltransferase RsmH [Ignavibacteriaceae bacterium]
MNNLIHIPVLARESVEYLIKNRDGKFFEATVGFGGHTTLILNQLGRTGILAGTDVNDAAFNCAKEKFENDDRFRLYKFNFNKIDLISKIESIDKFDGVFADLGVSSYQLDSAGEGFTFRMDTKLDLRMDKNLEQTAADVLNTESEETIANILYKYGEEKNSRKIARLIGERRRSGSFKTTGELVDIVAGITPPNFLNKSLMRVFQALRIYVNRELDVLEDFLRKAVNLLNTNGRIVILTYHSLEDRIVKDIFKEESSSCVCPKDFPVCICGKEKKLEILTRKPVLPSAEELKNNPRARSAKLRAAERV